MEGNKIKTNILIAGKSGLGKSSLLNYIGRGNGCGKARDG